MENDEPVKETVEHPEHTGETEATPAPVAPVHAETVTKDAFDQLTAKVDGLVDLVTQVVSPQQDSQPTKKPWTHWGNK
jgi:hypothetical protein